MRVRGGRLGGYGEGFGALCILLSGDGFSPGFCGGRWGPSRAAAGDVNGLQRAYGIHGPRLCFALCYAFRPGPGRRARTVARRPRVGGRGSERVGVVRGNAARSWPWTWMLPCWRLKLERARRRGPGLRASCRLTEDGGEILSRKVFSLKARSHAEYTTFLQLFLHTVCWDDI